MAQAANIGLGIANVFGIVAQEAAYSSGEAWLEELLIYLRGNYRRLADFIAERLPVLSVLPLEGSYLAWIDCRKLGMSDAELKDFFLKDAKLWLDEGPMFGSGGSGFMRMNVACPRSVLDEALARLEGAFARRADGGGRDC
jgi:cysteine-S-conjugate beta-lyase